VKFNNKEYLRATGLIQKKNFKMYIVPEGGHLNVGSKASNKILT